MPSLLSFRLEAAQFRLEAKQVLNTLFGIVV